MAASGGVSRSASEESLPVLEARLEGVRKGIRAPFQSARCQGEGRGERALNCIAFSTLVEKG
jgi:hypothetical protein